MNSKRVAADVAYVGQMVARKGIALVVVLTVSFGSVTSASLGALWASQQVSERERAIARHDPKPAEASVSRSAIHSFIGGALVDAIAIAMWFTVLQPR